MIKEFDMDCYSDLNKFKEWVKQKPTRHVTIKLIGSGSSIFAYDTELGTGQMVCSVDEINIEEVSRQEKLKEYEKLKKEFDINE